MPGIRRLLVLASGTPTGGGSGFEWLVEATQTGVIPNAMVVAVASNHETGGVYEKARDHDISFNYLPAPLEDKWYGSLASSYGADLACLSGWLKKVSGLDPAKTINIHPGPLPKFGGPGMYGHHVHEAVMNAYHRGEITESAVSMHFVTENYDEGPVFFRYPVAIRPDDTPKSLGDRVNEIEHAWQAFATNLVLDGKIWYNSLNGNVIVNPHVHRTLWHFFPESVVVESTYP